MPCRVFSPPDLAAQFSGLHVCVRTEHIDQSRLSRPAGAGQHRGLPPQDFLHLSQGLRNKAADKKDSTSAGLVGLPELMDLLLSCKVAFGKAENGIEFLFLHCDSGPS